MKLSEEEQAQIKDIFELLDTNGSGTIESHELDDAMLALGYRDSHSGSLQAPLGAGTTVNFEGFASLMQMRDQDPKQDLWAAFCFISGAGRATVTSGQSSWSGGADYCEPLSRECVQRAGRLCGVQLREEELDLMMQAACDHRTVDFDVFMQLMGLSPWFS